MRKIVGGIGVVIMIVECIAGFIAYFVYKMDPVTNIMYDGFGRPLSGSPFFMRWFFGQERLWAGWLWFVGDIVILWGGLFAGYWLAYWGFKGPDHSSLSNAD